MNWLFVLNLPAIYKHSALTNLSFLKADSLEKLGGEIIHKCIKTDIMFDRLNQFTYKQILLVGLIMILLTLILSGLGYLIGLMFWDMTVITSALKGITETSEEVNVLKMFQFLNQLSIFVLPPLILYGIVRKQEASFLKLNRLPNGLVFLVITLLLFALLPVIQQSMTWNSAMHLPKFMTNLEQWMHAQEDFAELLTNQFLKAENIGGFLINILVLALMPALGEELLFRGLMMHWLGKVMKNIHLNILITAFVFSAIHFQFFSFIPRFLLGIALGYVFYWTQSLWASIWLHFTNNALTVSVYYFAHETSSQQNPEDIEILNGSIWLLVSVVLSIVIFQWVHRNRVKPEDAIPST
jgi:membrane protease YdiL (CAAX protease family)